MFRLLGFDVHVRTGFVVFLALIVFLYQDRFGFWLAGGIAVFTLLHELGHAVAARSAGAQASISLDFLAGYTSFRSDPTRPLSRMQRAIISAAGPATQIAISVAVLVAMGVDPLSPDSARQSDQAAAIWWAGPVIGVMNLIPVLPLDGGHLAMTAIESVVGDRALRFMAIFSVAATALFAALLFGTGRGGFAIFVAFLLINQIQIVQATSAKQSRRHPLQRHVDAESQAWNTGRPGMLEPGQRLSPWYEAHRALALGQTDRAASCILDDLRSDRSTRWAMPSAASVHQLRAIVDLLPRDLPPGNPHSERVLAEILLATGDPQRAGEYAAAGFSRHHTSMLATVVARSAAQVSDTANAVSWLRAAADATGDEDEPFADLLANVMDHAPEFATLRTTADFTAVRTALV
jgi:Zn-dependent protease